MIGTYVSFATGECEHCPYGFYLTSPPLPRDSYSPTSLGIGLGLVMGGILVVSFAIFAHYCYEKAYGKSDAPVDDDDDAGSSLKH